MFDDNQADDNLDSMLLQAVMYIWTICLTIGLTNWVKNGLLNVFNH